MKKCTISCKAVSSLFFLRCSFWWFFYFKTKIKPQSKLETKHVLPRSRKNKILKNIDFFVSNYFENYYIYLHFICCLKSWSFVKFPLLDLKYLGFDSTHGFPQIHSICSLSSACISFSGFRIPGRPDLADRFKFARLVDLSILNRFRCL